MIDPFLQLRRKRYTETMRTGNDQYVDFVMEQLAPLRHIATTRFFGGTGLTANGTQFAMIMGGDLYFVVDDTTRPSYEQMGSRCFAYNTKKKRVDVRKYYAVPADILEDQDRLVVLAKEAIGVAGLAIAVSSKRPPSKK